MGYTCLQCKHNNNTSAEDGSVCEYCMNGDLFEEDTADVHGDAIK